MPSLRLLSEAGTADDAQQALKGLLDWSADLPMRSTIAQAVSRGPAKQNYSVVCVIRSSRESLRPRNVDNHPALAKRVVPQRLFCLRGTHDATWC
jgi:hypothetical protein